MLQRPPSAAERADLHPLGPARSAGDADRMGVMDGLVDLRIAARARRPSVPRMPAYVASALATWRGRMMNEHGSARVFDALAGQLDRAGLPGGDECRAFAVEERDHGVSCGAVVEALGGEAAFGELEGEAVPEHADVERSEAALRNVMSVGCLSETVAVALIGAERLAMPDGELREVLSRILADEIGHARFGWRLLTEAAAHWDREERARMSRYLTVALAYLERHELAHIDASAHPGEDALALGLCDGGDARRLFYATVEEVIVPQLAALGLDAKQAWARRADVP